MSARVGSSLLGRKRNDKTRTVQRASENRRSFLFFTILIFFEYSHSIVSVSLFLTEFGMGHEYPNEVELLQRPFMENLALKVGAEELRQHCYSVALLDSLPQEDGFHIQKGTGSFFIFVRTKRCIDWFLSHPAWGDIQELAGERKVCLVVYEPDPIRMRVVV